MNAESRVGLPRRRPATAGPVAGRVWGAILVVAVAAMALSVPWLAPRATAGPAVPSQQRVLLVAPNLQTAGNWDFGSLDAPAGMDGMGESVIELQNMASRPVALEFDLFSNVVSRVVTSAALGPLAAARFPLESVPNTDFSHYSARISADGPIGGVVRTTWYGGASTVHEALTPARELVLPLVAREVYSNSAIIYIKNLSEPGRTNTIDFELFEDDGSIRKSWTVKMQGDEALPDDLFRERVFYRDLPVNAAGGFIGAFHVVSEDPVAMLIYGDEPIGVGSYALVAKPVTAANERQYLPLVRSNYQGDTLITVTSVERNPVDVTITYQGHPYSPSGAGQTFRQTLRLPARYYATIDLSELGRGSVAGPDVPRGDGFNTGFLGSAYIRASGRVLAAVWEEYRESNYVLGSAAYNAFGPNDLGTVFVSPRAFMAADGQPSFMIAMNPGTEPTDIRTTLYNDDGTIYGDLYPVRVPAGEMRFIAIATPDYANVRVLMQSTEPVAMLVLDARPMRDRTIYAAVRMPADVVFPTATPTVQATEGPSPTTTPLGPADTPTVMPPRPPGDYWSFLPASFRRH